MPTAALPIPTVSVIVPAYGVAHLLGDALASLVAQDMPDWEAIVVDDGAPDDVAGAVARFAHDPRIRLLATDNRGVSTARNRAVAAARAPLVAMLDGDDAWAPTYLTAMLAALRSDPHHGLACCDATFFGEGARTGRRFSEFAPQDGPPTLARVLDRRFNVFTAALVVKAAFEAVGGYDPALPAAEDFDLWVRLLEAGWSAIHVPRPLARYRRRPGSLSTQTVPMLRALARVYDGAAVRLGTRPEAAIAVCQRLATEEAIAFVEGEQLIFAGETRAGLARLRAAGPRARKPIWRISAPLLRLLPRLGPPLMRWRRMQERAG